MVKKIKRNGDTLVGNVDKLTKNVAETCELLEIAHIEKIVKNSFMEIESAYRSSSIVTGMSTGFRNLDSITNGFNHSELIIIAGRPGMGKTAFALNLAKNCAESPGCCKVAFFSLESSNEQLVIRLLSSLSEVKTQNLSLGLIEDLEWLRLATAAAAISELPIYMDDTPISVMEMQAKAQCLKKEKGLDMVIIDYLQLIQSDGASPERVSSDILRSLKEMAKVLNVPVVILSQLGRGVEARFDKRPQLSDLHELEAIERYADVIMSLYRDELYYKYNPYNEGIVEIVVHRQRNGPSGGVASMNFLSEFSTFLEL